MHDGAIGAGDDEGAFLLPGRGGRPGGGNCPAVGGIHIARQGLDGLPEAGDVVVRRTDFQRVLIVHAAIDGKAADDHVRPLGEIGVYANLVPVDRDRDCIQPAGGMTFGLAGHAFAQEHKIRDDLCSLIAEGDVRQAHRAEEVGMGGDVFPGRCAGFVEGEAAGDQGEHAARRQDIHGFGYEIVVQGEPAGSVIERDVGERHVPDSGIGSRKPGVAEVLDADIVVRIKGLRDPPG